jgi:beta-galactosidase/beta-glucuronidase
VSDVHRIRLRAPWEIAQGESGTLLRRRFGKPANLAETDRVHLTFSNIQPAARIQVNGEIIGEFPSGSGPFAGDITQLLQRRNLLEIRVDVTAASEMVLGEVALEIRSASL